MTSERFNEIRAQHIADCGNVPDNLTIARLHDHRAELLQAMRPLLPARRLLAVFTSLANEAWVLLDEDKDMKCLRLLRAMAGRAKGYRADTDTLHEKIGEMRT